MKLKKQYNKPQNKGWKRGDILVCNRIGKEAYTIFQSFENASHKTFVGKFYYYVENQCFIPKEFTAYTSHFSEASFRQKERFKEFLKDHFHGAINIKALNLN